jgi:hypothetical protein
MNLNSPFVDLLQFIFVIVGAFFIARGYKTVKEMGGFDTANPFQTSYRMWLGFFLTTIGLVLSVLCVFFSRIP